MLDKLKRPLGAVCTVAAGVALVWALAPHAAEVRAALGSAPAGSVALLVTVAVIVLALRAEASVVCLRSAGAALTRTEIHGGSAAMFVAGVVNPFAGTAARVAVFRRLAPQRSLSTSQLVASDAPVFLVETVLTAVVLVPAALALGLAWWVPVLALATVAVVVLCARHASRRFSAHAACEGLNALAAGHSLRRLVALLTLVFAGHVLRSWLAMSAAGVDASPAKAGVFFVLTGLVTLLPVGQAAPTTVAVLLFGEAGVGPAAAAGVLVSASTVAAAGTYAAWASCVFGGRFVCARAAANAPGEQEKPPGCADAVA